MQVIINTIDRTDHVVANTLMVRQNLTSQVDTAKFTIRKYGSRTYTPSYGDSVAVYDGAKKIFGGSVLSINESLLSGSQGLSFDIDCVDHTYEMDKLLVSRVYENQSIKDIVADVINTYAPTFDESGVSSTFIIDKIVFNQVTISSCLKKLAEIIRNDWYVDENKKVWMIDKYSDTAPFGLTDTAGNHVVKSLVRLIDGSQIVNRVKIRGGEYDGATFTDVITVKGNNSTSFTLPYRFSDLTIELDTGSGYIAKTVGIDNIDDFTSKDVLYNFQEKTIRFQSALLDNNKIRFSGKPKVRVFGVAEDPDSIAQYGKIEKLLRDNSIQSNAIARRRASAELYAYSDKLIEARFNTYQSGLRAGMTLNVQSDIRGNNDDLIIKSITFKPLDHTNFAYSVECISSKRYDLMQILSKLLEPEPLNTDEAEVSEEIFTDTQSVSITEEIDFVAAFEDDTQSVTISENTLLNPVLPANVEFVWSDYTPTGQTDTKRPGRFDISLTFY